MPGFNYGDNSANLVPEMMHCPVTLINHRLKWLTAFKNIAKNLCIMLSVLMTNSVLANPPTTVNVYTYTTGHVNTPLHSFGPTIYWGSTIDLGEDRIFHYHGQIYHYVLRDFLDYAFLVWNGIGPSFNEITGRSRAAQANANIEINFDSSFGRAISAPPGLDHSDVIAAGYSPYTYDNLPDYLSRPITEGQGTIYILNTMDDADNILDSVMPYIDRSTADPYTVMKMIWVLTLAHEIGHVFGFAHSDALGATSYDMMVPPITLSFSPYNEIIRSIEFTYSPEPALMDSAGTNETFRSIYNYRHRGVQFSDIGLSFYEHAVAVEMAQHSGCYSSAPNTPAPDICYPHDTPKKLICGVASSTTAGLTTFGLTC